MIHFYNERLACMSCINGHRASGCMHIDKELIAIGPRGRPTQNTKNLRFKFPKGLRIVAFTKNPINGSKTNRVVECLHVDPRSPFHCIYAHQGGKVTPDDEYCTMPEAVQKTMSVRVIDHGGANIRPEDLFPLREEPANVFTYINKATNQIFYRVLPQYDTELKIKACPGMEDTPESLRGELLRYQKKADMNADKSVIDSLVPFHGSQPVVFPKTEPRLVTPAKPKTSKSPSPNMLREREFKQDVGYAQLTDFSKQLQTAATIFDNSPFEEDGRSFENFPKSNNWSDTPSAIEAFFNYDGVNNRPDQQPLVQATAAPAPTAVYHPTASYNPEKQFTPAEDHVQRFSKYYGKVTLGSPPVSPNKPQKDSSLALQTTQQLPCQEDQDVIADQINKGEEDVECHSEIMVLLDQFDFIQDGQGGMSAVHNM